jgi:hypothetical protein
VNDGNEIAFFQNANDYGVVGECASLSQFKLLYVSLSHPKLHGAHCRVGRAKQIIVPKAFSSGNESPDPSGANKTSKRLDCLHA